MILDEATSSIDTRTEALIQRGMDALMEDRTVFSEVKVWECRNCGHIVVGGKAPEICPVCAHPQAYFEIHAENY